MVDVGAVEVFNSDLNQRRTYQLYLNPEYSIPRDVINADGITEEKVKKEPALPELTEKFLRCQPHSFNSYAFLYCHLNT